MLPFGDFDMQCREFPQSIQQMLGQGMAAPFHIISSLSSNLPMLYSGVTDSIVKQTARINLWTIR
jgi:hypothetical protein